MVFANLSSHEKDAFFGLLDEYFQARPEIFAGASSEGGGGGLSQGAAASAVHRALASNPEATSRLVSAGLTHAGGGARPNSYMAAASNPEVSSSIGRVAAASLAFSSNNAKSPPPPAPPRRESGNDASSADGEHNKLVSARKFGNVDTSSTKNMFGSMIRKTPAAPAAAPPVPSAFSARKGGFAPPPVRRGASDSSEARSPSPAVPPPSRYQAPVAQQEEEEEEVQGEWAEVLYDYSSEDPADIQIKANQRILVTEKSSEDWWTGTADGKQGLFPASYVRLL
ncbi:hypothetical protein SERLA73DRAFT_176720 [Serpula lacrymans var. lacrymans S7.3]|uniref:SH3 domain-containing protein n=2 Tax=Serpula lacrymans var. lacrymans TaxID=341189 RepID=F8PPT5_SERL3|nr:uncharacterized protein SERLADRAFT_459958 [Serpula lacrymans var. lacrymans S7.9]EGO01452.1 hypothetical protein SERLA73DRAFT_176720 [Serpula lacrymans var. lacrymans S7.3]EGO27115.1 hypothetical protein SERLADRAFT_459958 [Serpula lacrymans var. lacrymans S7.9]